MMNLLAALTMLVVLLCWLRVRAMRQQGEVAYLAQIRRDYLLRDLEWNAQMAAYKHRKRVNGESKC